MACTEIKSRWIVYPNIKGKTIRLTKDSKGEYVYDFGVGRVSKKDTKNTSYKGKDWNSLK